VRCEFRNSWCDFLNGPCRYGTINAMQALAVSSDAFFYKLGEEFYLRGRTLMQDQLELFGFGADTGIDLPYEYGGRVPDDESKEALVAAGVLRPGEEPRLLVGDNVQTSIGQGLLAATPLQLAVGYGAVANGGYVLTPHVVKALYEPGVPDGEPGFADLTLGTVHESRERSAEVRQIPMGPELRDPLVNGLRRNITGPGVNGRSTTAEELFEVGYPDTAIPVAGKTGTAQGQGNYPWTDSSVFAAFSMDPTKPYTTVTYLEKAGFGSLGAAPVVKCIFLALSGLVETAPVAMSDPLDPTSSAVARPQRLADTSCMASSDASERPVD
jgi:penicillin-binding protein 2